MPLHVCVFSCIQLFETPWTVAHQAPPSMEFSGKNPEAGGLSNPRIKLTSPTLAAAAPAKSYQSCLTVCDPIDSRPPGSPVPGILQAGTLEWVTTLAGKFFTSQAITKYTGLTSTTSHFFFGFLRIFFFFFSITYKKRL